MTTQPFKGVVNFLSYDPEQHEYNIEVDGVSAKCDPFIGHSHRSPKLKGWFQISGKWHGKGNERCLLVDDLKEVPLSERLDTAYTVPPALKAKLIYDRFRSLTYISHTRAKILAKITAEESRDAVYAHVIHIGQKHEDNVYYQYWQTVIKEIKKL